MKRVAAITLDAAEWPHLEREMARGALPNLARISEQSYRCRLGNVRGFRSEAVWTQFMTGQPPERSGYWTNVAFDPSSYEVWDVGASGLRPFWADWDIRTIAFDIPHSSPDGSPRTVQCTGWGAHSPLYPRTAKPAGLLEEIDRRFGPHPAFLQDNTPCWWDEEFLRLLTDAAVEGALTRVEIVRWLEERYRDWNLVIAVMSEAHSVGHHAWHGADDRSLAAREPSAGAAAEALERTYRALDAAVGRFAYSLPAETNLLVFSLHGMQVNTNDLPSTALLPELLLRLQVRRKMLVNPRRRRWRAGGYPVSPPAVSWMADALGLWADSPKRRVRRLLHGTLPPPVARSFFEGVRKVQGRESPVERFGTFPITAEVAPPPPGSYRAAIDYQPATWYQRYWAQMAAFALPTFSDGHIRINLRGREASGIVEPSQYAATCERVVRWLRETVDPRTGGPVVEDIEVQSSPDRAGPPADIVVYWRERLDAFEHPVAGVIGPVPLLRTGEHSSGGFAMLSGPGIVAGDGGARSALDLPPTVATLLGMPAPELAGESLVPS